MLMLAYSALLTLGLLVSAPWWLFRMATTDRYREGLKQRLGFLPISLCACVAGKRIVWLHAVSVGETLAATRLVAELEAALGEGWRVVISTTTRTGHALASQRFGAERVFYMPLDFAFATRAYFNALKPAALLLMESELWPRLLHECSQRNIPVAVANARISDRSYRRAMRVRFIWVRVLRKPTLWLTQSAEDTHRLRSLIDPAHPSSVILSEVARTCATQSKDPQSPLPATTLQALSATNANAQRTPIILTTGNLKYDIRAPRTTQMTTQIAGLFSDRTIVVAGSTTGALKENGHNDEEDLLVGLWSAVNGALPKALLIVAPRHPERFAKAIDPMHQVKGLVASELCLHRERKMPLDGATVLCLDTIGDLASVYSIATIAFVGGSLVPRGGHNPLEPAQFGVPVIMGPSFENFRDIVAKLQAADGIRIVQNAEELEATLTHLLTHPDEARALGQRGRAVFESQQGATARTVTAILAMMKPAIESGAPPLSGAERVDSEMWNSTKPDGSPQ